MAFCPKEVVDGWDHSMHAREVGKEKLQSLIHSNKGKRLMARSNKRKICHVGMSSSGNGWATNGLVGNFEGMSIANQK